MGGEKKKCFVVTPIGDEESPIRRHIDGIIDQAIAPALEEKYVIDVAHRKYEIGSISDRVIKSIYNADLVIVNLTGLNPNVMFELAIRYSFGKPAIVIAEEGTKLPFDIVEENTAFYINDPAGANDLRNKIKAFEANIDFDRKDYGPVHKAINTIPLYREVESGQNVSMDKMLTYLIERLDSIENRIESRIENSTQISKRVDYEVIFIVSEQEIFSGNKELMDKIKNVASKVKNIAVLKYSLFDEICFVLRNVNSKNMAELFGKEIELLLRAEGINVTGYNMKII